MIPQLIETRLLGPVNLSPALIVLTFFAYSFLGYVLECIVLTVEKRSVVVNRGFASHLPFCIIYGFGAMTGYAVLEPLADNAVLLFLAGALGATVFEFLVAQIQIRLFGDFWWDYHKKRLNYRGIVCLESTLAWGIAAILVVRVAHRAVVGLVSRIPSHIAVVLAVGLVAAYLADFAWSARAAARQRREELETADEYYYRD